jgi:hypothetical protein
MEMTITPMVVGEERREDDQDGRDLEQPHVP